MNTRNLPVPRLPTAISLPTPGRAGRILRIAVVAVVTLAGMPQPVLESARLRLEPLADEHLPHEVELDGDPEVMRYLDAAPHTPEVVAHWHSKRLAVAEEHDNLGYWAAFHDTEFVGLLMLPPTGTPGEAELGYRIARPHWRKGYASEASHTLLRHAFETAGLTRVIAQTMTVNKPSQAVMLSLGMRYVRTFHPAFDNPLPGTDQGEVEYEITHTVFSRS
jgi:RimJ/RimL family protein N-acetyltransferase